MQENNSTDFRKVTHGHGRNH